MVYRSTIIIMIIVKTLVTTFMLIMGMGMLLDAILAVSGCTITSDNGLYQKSALFAYNVDWATNSLMFMMSGMAFVAAGVLLTSKK